MAASIVLTEEVLNAVLNGAKEWVNYLKSEVSLSDGIVFSHKDIIERRANGEPYHVDNQKAKEIGARVYEAILTDRSCGFGQPIEFSRCFYKKDKWFEGREGQDEFRYSNMLRKMLERARKTNPDK